MVDEHIAPPPPDPKLQWCLTAPGNTHTFVIDSWGYVWQGQKCQCGFATAPKTVHAPTEPKLFYSYDGPLDV